jgi:hypothetical protein
MPIVDEGQPPGGHRPDGDEPDADEHQRIIEKTARALVDRRLGTPALFVLESMRPLSFVASQGLLFLQPIVESVLTIPEYRAFQRMLEDRKNIDRLVEQIEAFEDERLKAQDEDR